MKKVVLLLVFSFFSFVATPSVTKDLPEEMLSVSCQSIAIAIANAQYDAGLITASEYFDVVLNLMSICEEG